VRLGILTAVNEVSQADFGYLRGLLALTDGNLSRHLDVLARDALVDVVKGYEGRRARTWIVITPRGREALKAEIDALRRLISRYDLLAEHSDMEA
jgi:DNA-binding MarR family transcriptional regulator